MQALLQKFDRRQFRLLLIGVGTVVIALTATYAVVPPTKAYRAATKSVAALEEISRNGGELKTQLQARQKSIADLQRKLHGDMANLPEKEIEAYIIGRLQKISWGNDVELVSVEPGPGETVEIFREMLFGVQLIGQYQNLYRWLWEAREELGFVVIKEYRVERQGRDDEDPFLIANISLASYRAEN